MTSRYRLLQLKPDLRRDDVVTVGAFLEHHDEIQFVEAPSLPDARCLGSKKAHRHLQYVRETIERTGPEQWWESVPSQVGHGVKVSEVRSLEQQHPVGWLKRQLLPNYHADRTETPRKSRAKLGKRFFENQGVGQYVRHRHRLNATYHLAGLDFPSISLVTLGADDVLLIEPLKFGRPSFNDDVRKTALRFQSARGAQRTQPDSFESRPFQTVTVLLPGITDEGREFVHQKIANATDHLFDTTERTDRTQVRDLVRDVGSTAAAME